MSNPEVCARNVVAETAAAARISDVQLLALKNLLIYGRWPSPHWSAGPPSATVRVLNRLVNHGLAQHTSGFYEPSPRVQRRMQFYMVLVDRERKLAELCECPRIS